MEDQAQGLTLAKRDQEILLGRRGHFDLERAEILTDEGKVAGVFGDGRGPRRAPGPLKTPADHGPPPWRRLRGGPALADAASAVPPPWRRPRGGQALADAAWAVDAIRMQVAAPPLANPLPLCTGAASPSPPSAGVSAAVSCGAASVPGSTELDASGANAPMLLGVEPEAPETRGTAFQGARPEAAPLRSAASERASVDPVLPDPREAAGASSAVACGAAPGAHALEATLPHGVASEHARVGPVLLDVQREEPAPETMGIDPERPQPAPAFAPVLRPTPRPQLLRQALTERARWLASRPHRRGQLDAREIVDVLNQMKEGWLASTVGAGRMNAAERKRAWQKHLHTTAPRSEKAIRLAIGCGIGDVDVLLAIVHADSRANAIKPSTAGSGQRPSAQVLRRRARRTEMRGRCYLRSLAKCTACGDDAPEGDLRACGHCSMTACKSCLPEGRRNCWRCPETDRVFDDGEPDRSCSCNGCHNSS